MNESAPQGEPAPFHCYVHGGPAGSVGTLCICGRADTQAASTTSLALVLEVSQDPESGWWKIFADWKGKPTGIFIANPSLDLCMGDVLTSWRALARLSPTQVPPVSAAPVAAPSVAVPDGWKLVLVEPTVEMLSAVDDAYGDGGDFGDMWAAALAATPPAPLLGEGGPQPVAWAVFSDNGNIRIWSTSPDLRESWDKAVPLYAALPLPAVVQASPAPNMQRLHIWAGKLIATMGGTLHEGIVTFKLSQFSAYVSAVAAHVLAMNPAKPPDADT